MRFAQDIQRGGQQPVTAASGRPTQPVPMSDKHRAGRALPADAVRKRRVLAPKGEWCKQAEQTSRQVSARPSTSSGRTDNGVIPFAVNRLIPFVVSLSNHEWDPRYQSSPDPSPRITQSSAACHSGKSTPNVARSFAESSTEKAGRAAFVG